VIVRQYCNVPESQLGWLNVPHLNNITVVIIIINEQINMAFSPKTSSGHVTNKGKENGDVLFFVLLYYIFFRECDKRVTHCIFHVH